MFFDRISIIIIMVIIMGLFDSLRTPKWKHKDWQKRMQAVKFELDDEQILADIAKNDESTSVREEAVKKIKDKKILEDITYNASDSSIRLRAVRKIKDETILEDISRNNPYNRIQTAAINNIKNEELLINIAKNNENSDVRIEAIKKINNQNALANIFKTTTDNEVRNIIVLDKINNEYILKDIDGDEILLNIIKNSGEKSANKAIDKITDKESLVKLFQTKKPECSSEILDKAFKKIDDDSLLKIIVLECPFTLYNSSLSYTALKRIKNGDIILDIFNNSPDSNIKKEARKILTENYPNLLKDIDASDLNNINLLIENNDEFSLAKIITSADQSDENRTKALNHINNELILKDIVLLDEVGIDYLYYRLDALEKISNEIVLAEIVDNTGKTTFHEEVEISLKAIEKISIQKILSDISLNNRNTTKLREKAIEKITNKETLKILTNDSTKEIVRDRKIVGYSDRDGAEYENESAEVFPIRSAAERRIIELDNIEINKQYEENDKRKLEDCEIEYKQYKDDYILKKKNSAK